jgi:thioredoxin 1
MPTIDITEATFQDTLTKNEIVLVDWWADWCGPCKAFAPTFEQKSDEHSDIVFAKVDTEAEQELAGEAGIQSIPTLMAFRDGVLLYREAGVLPAAALSDLITQIRGLDMDQVRAEIAAQGSEG